MEKGSEGPQEPPPKKSKKRYPRVLPPTHLSKHCGGVNKNGEHCKNMTTRDGLCAIHLKNVMGLAVKRSSHHGQLGLFVADKPPKDFVGKNGIVFEPGDKIAPFKGPVLSKNQVHDFYKGFSTGKHVVKLGKDSYIDGRKTTSSVARFAKKAPHSTAKLEKASNGPEALLVARKPLKAGQEVTIGRVNARRTIGVSKSPWAKKSAPFTPQVGSIYDRPKKNKLGTKSVRGHGQGYKNGKEYEL